MEKNQVNDHNGIIKNQDFHHERKKIEMLAC